MRPPPELQRLPCAGSGTRYCERVDEGPKSRVGCSAHRLGLGAGSSRGDRILVALATSDPRDVLNAVDHVGDRRSRHLDIRHRGRLPQLLTGLAVDALEVSVTGGPGPELTDERNPGSGVRRSAETDLR